MNATPLTARRLIEAAQDRRADASWHLPPVQPTITQGRAYRRARALAGLK